MQIFQLVSATIPQANDMRAIGRPAAILAGKTMGVYVLLRREMAHRYETWRPMGYDCGRRWHRNPHAPSGGPLACWASISPTSAFSLSLVLVELLPKGFGP